VIVTTKIIVQGEGDCVLEFREGPSTRSPDALLYTVSPVISSQPIKKRER
jgi:hypothetical protein